MDAMSPAGPSTPAVKRPLDPANVHRAMDCAKHVLPYAMQTRNCVVENESESDNVSIVNIPTAMGCC